MMTAPIVPTACVVAYDLSSGSAHPVARAAPSGAGEPPVDEEASGHHRDEPAISTSR